MQVFLNTNLTLGRKEEKNFFYMQKQDWLGDSEEHFLANLSELDTVDGDEVRGNKCGRGRGLDSKVNAWYPREIVRLHSSQQMSHGLFVG